MKKYLLASLVLVGSIAFANEGGGHGAVDPHAIPWKTIGVQTFNFIILIGILVHFLRQAIKDHFALRLKTYTDLVQRADNAKAEAEKSHREIAERLRQLQSTADQSIQKAREEAEVLKQKMIEEAKTISARIQEESKRSAQLEVEKAKAVLRKDLLSRALDASRENLKKSLGTSEQKRLQNEFVEKIQVVRG